MYTKFWSKNLKVRDYSEDQGVDGSLDNTRTYLKQIGWEGVTGFIWFTI